MALDPDIVAAYGSGASQATTATNVDPDIAAAFHPGAGDTVDNMTHFHIPLIGDVAWTKSGKLSQPETGTEAMGEDLGAGPLLGSGNFWRGVGRGALGTYYGSQNDVANVRQVPKSLAAPYGLERVEGPSAGEAEARERAQRWGLLRGEETPEGIAGQTIGGMFGIGPYSAAPAGGPLIPRGASVNSQQSISAAAATPNLAGASPELRAKVQEVTDAGGTVNNEVLARHAEAESLPVPAQLTKGQATRDPALFSNEQNLRLKEKQFGDTFNAQNQNLADNLQAIRENVGPDVFSTNKVEHGDTLIKAYKDKAAAADAITDQKYQALRDANGGQFPLDAPTLKANVTNALYDQMLFEHAPAAEMAQLSKAADAGSMPFSRYEAMRTNLARIARTSADGNERAAAGVIRQEMEKLPLTGDAANLKPLADDARATARAQFQALDEDPAYKAAVNDTVPPDRFVNRFIINGNRDDVALMRQNLAHDPVATQTMGVAALDHLRDSASLSDLYQGTFRQAGYNKHLQALDPKMSTLFAPKDAGDIRALGNVARNQLERPAGAAVNESNTATTLLGQNAKNVAEGLVNAKTGGLYGAVAKPLFKARAARKLAEEHLSVGAGLDYPAK